MNAEKRRQPRTKPRPEEERSTELIEKLILGLTPDDRLPSAEETLPFSARPALRGAGPAADLALVAAYTEAEPEVAAAVSGELAEAWQRADGRRPEYLAQAAEARAGLISRAQVHQGLTVGPQATLDVLSALDEYLADAEARAGAARTRATPEESFSS